ncbi:hypothetical protein R3W88_030627 [Solanum pinnatisectum]|uniref:RING-type E3 ubiquitin transferase n=1 Tax=Solanum pinnatisectum TaxID=50273 RepID=A0AAV9LJ29_9SOLN|nr:hypothetical protein R3W88_030627 [Solanum pinnatisectum]
MEISLLKVLLSNISQFFHLSSSESIVDILVQRYYCKAEDLLKILKPILEAIVDVEAAFSEMLQKAFAGLAQFVDELRELCETWQPLGSNVYFVLQAEPLIVKIRTCSLEILELLKTSHECLPADTTLTSLEHCILKIKYVDYELMSMTITKSIKAQMEGLGANSDSFAKLADCLRLKSNQELLIELVALEKLKENAEQAEKTEEVEYIEQIIALVSHLHDCFITMKQSQICTPVPIPPDFCCPLSLELMTDPVIVASGQTYERAFIRKWIDLGLTVCPKTRQMLGHTTLIPNYTVKALVANWCESNNVKLPDSTKSLSLNQPSSLLAHADSGMPRDTQGFPLPRGHHSSSPDSARSLSSPRKSLISSSMTQREGLSPSHPYSSLDDSLPGVASNMLALDVERISIKSSEEWMAHSGEINSHGHCMLAANEHSLVGHNRTTSAAAATDASDVSESQPAASLSVLQREPKFPSMLETRVRNQSIWLRPSERFPRIVSSATVERRADLLELEEQVRKLVQDLSSNSIDVQRDATAELRLLAKHNMDNRVVMANCGSINLLVNLLHSEDMKVQENAVTTLLNLSINNNNKCSIANADAIEPLIHVLHTGSGEAKENSAATLFSLSVIEDNKMKIGRSGAIKPLVDLLGNGSPRGKKDAATALFNLSILHENKGRIVQAGAVKFLVELMDPAAGMVDKAVAVLSNLATIHEGRAAIGQEGGIPVLVEVVELGSARGRENAAAALLQLCTNSSRFCNMVLQEGAVPPLVALSQSGTPRAREKAQGLLSYFRSQRHGNAGRG